MSSGPVYNGGASSLLWCGDRGEAPYLRVGGDGWRWKRVSAVAGRTRRPRLELMPSPGRLSVVPAARRQVRETAGTHAPSAVGAIARLQADETQTHIARSRYNGSDQAKPVARAAFLATRLTLAPVFRTALFADFIAFAVFDFLRFAIFHASRSIPDSFRLALFAICAKPVSPSPNDEMAQLPQHQACDNEPAYLSFSAMLRCSLRWGSVLPAQLFNSGLSPPLA